MKEPLGNSRRKRFGAILENSPGETTLPPSRASRKVRMRRLLPSLPAFVEAFIYWGLLLLAVGFVFTLLI